MLKCKEHSCQAVITHKRVQLCSLHYKDYRVQRWKLNEVERAKKSGYLERRRIVNIIAVNKWLIDNKDRKSFYYKNYKSNPLNRLKINLRKRLTEAVKHNHKSGSAVKDLGCSIAEFKIYIESKFQVGMTWDNWSRDGWHIDHIKPLASFDLTDLDQLKSACHYTNLQPLWAIDNLSKGDSYE
jgi:hypothetical protein